jgi:hypothetical protein
MRGNEYECRVFAYLRRAQSAGRAESRQGGARVDDDREPVELVDRAEHRPGLRARGREPHREAVAEQVRGFARHLPRVSLQYGSGMRRRTLNSTSTSKLFAVTGRRDQSQPIWDGFARVSRTCLFVFCALPREPCLGYTTPRVAHAQYMRPRRSPTI